MEKKYQVFISSTYKDLLDERSEVMQALLELDCIPVGMELFPAADDDQWTLIKRLIDDCDYYILIIGGRYGSVHPIEGISYTQMEYEYAIKQNIPTISFIHKNPTNIQSGKTDQDPSARVKLELFKKLAENKLCKYWETPFELGGVVSRSLIKLIKDKPRPGWVKSIHVPDEDTNVTILDLRDQIDKLNSELKNYLSAENLEIKELAQGEDTISIFYHAKIWDYRSATDRDGEYKKSWDYLFSLISPFMVHEIEENDIKSTIIENIKVTQFEEENKRTSGGIVIETNDDVFQTIKIQLQALGLIEKSRIKKSIKETGNYWTLSKKGNDLMIRLRAIKRNEK